MTDKSFVPGALGEWMTVDASSFVGAPGSLLYSVQVDVSSVPLDQVASIGFSSYGVVD